MDKTGPNSKLSQGKVSKNNQKYRKIPMRKDYESDGNSY